MSWSKAVDILIISRILSPARPLGLKQNVYCVKNMSGWHSAIVTLIIWQPSLKFPKWECSFQNDVLHCTCIYGSLYRCGEMVAHAFSLNTGWTLGLKQRTPNKERKEKTTAFISEKNGCVRIWVKCQSLQQYKYEFFSYFFLSPRNSWLSCL